MKIRTLGKILVMARKDLLEMLHSPIAYVLLVIFTLVTGYFFSQPLFLIRQANLAPFLDLVPLVLVFLVPAVTMRSFSEEFRQGTHEILFTLPFKTYEIVAGKFLACWSLVALSLAATLFYPVLLELLGDLDWGAVAGAYLGQLFLAASLTAIGIFASGITRNQIVAYLVAWMISFVFFMAAKVLMFFPHPFSGIVGFLGFDLHLANISRGVIDTRDLIYFSSMSVFFLAVLSLRLEKVYRSPAS